VNTRTPPTAERRSAAAQWRSIVRAVHADAKRRQARLPLEDPYRGERARSFARLSGVAETSDPFLRLVRSALTPQSTLLDVGAGAGRYALALAPEVDEVIAVEPSPELLELLGRQANDLGVKNVRLVESRWEDVDEVSADVVVCYGVIGGIEDGARFLRKLDHAARRAVFIGLTSGVDVLRDPLWRHFHGLPSPPAPSFLDAVDLLAELGITPGVRILEYPAPVYDDLDDAVFAYRDLLQLPSIATIDADLRGVLRLWLIRRRDGRFLVPGRTFTYSALSWSRGSAKT
jgi:precorrin-6B methylase 2